jgi:3-deoxy-D-manno-octulosonate 8-phosphate phosphatase (KDO 8-P phosphatase)
MKHNLRPNQACLRRRLEKIKLFLCDVDGVLTDGTVIVGADREAKVFDIRDGLGLVFLRDAGVKIGWVSARPSMATTLRAEELKIDLLVQSKDSKVAAVEALLAKTRLNWDDLCFVGDDVVDLGVLKRAGLAVAVADGIAEVLHAAHYVTRASGGRGAIREVVEMILKAQGHWDRIVAEHAA